MIVAYHHRAVKHIYSRFPARVFIRYQSHRVIGVSSASLGILATEILSPAISSSSSSSTIARESR